MTETKVIYSSAGYTVKIARGDGIFLLHMHNGENQLSVETVKELEQCLTAIQQYAQTALTPSTKVGLVLTGEGKYFSLGLDLSSYYQQANPQEAFHKGFLAWVARLITWPMVTVAALNGHCVAGGMIVAMACDYRIMSGSRGFLFMNEILLPSSIPAGMLAVLQARLTDPKVLRDCVLQGRRFTGEEGHSLGMVDELVETGQDVTTAALDLAERLAHTLHKAPFIEVIKRVQLKDTLKVLVDPKDIDHFKLAAVLNKI